MYAPLPQAEGQRTPNAAKGSLRRVVLGSLIALIILALSGAVVRLGPSVSASNSNQLVQHGTVSNQQEPKPKPTPQPKKNVPSLDNDDDTVDGEGETEVAADDDALKEEEEDGGVSDKPLVEADVTPEERDKQVGHEETASEEEENPNKPPSEAAEEDPEDQSPEDKPSPEEPEATTEEEEANSIEESPKKGRLKQAEYGKCEYWTRHVREQFPTQCKYWMETINDWEASVKESRHQVAYYCNGDSTCHGWGDRLAGMLAAFFKATSSNAAFRIGHEYLPKLFKPCVLSEGTNTDWTANNFVYFPGKSCPVGDVACSTWLGRKCTQPALVGIHTNRVCLEPARCAGLKRMYGDALNAVHIVGCPSRALFEPSKELFEDTAFPFSLNGKTESLTLKQIQELFEETYYVISVQMRLGDNIAFNAKQASSVVHRDRKQLMTPFKCAATIESYLRATGQIAPGKQVRYFLASDSLDYRAMVEETLQDKIMAFDFKPEHIGLSGKKFGLTKELAEWYVLGLGEQLVLNKVGLAGDYFHGRISAFAKTAWVHHLKHLVYDAGTCHNYSVTLDGTWEDIKRRGCNNHKVTGLTAAAFPQQHLAVLANRNLTFPAHFVDQEEITSGTFKVQPKKPVKAESEDQPEGSEEEEPDDEP
jgi:hypothetical protein